LPVNNDFAECQFHNLCNSVLKHFETVFVKKIKWLIESLKKGRHGKCRPRDVGGKRYRTFSFRVARNAELPVSGKEEVREVATFC
jgi:hypothetical protein